MGGFYTPTNQVENNKDNDGVSHPGFNTKETNLARMGLIYSATCDYCPGGFWPDNKSSEHTLLIFSTEQPLLVALDKLDALVRDDVYV